jgi:hypothetical protein
LIRGKCLNTIYRRVSKSNLKYTFLIGNHCWFNLECKEHSLEPLKALPNVVIVDEPLVLDGIACIPYTHDLEKLDAIISNLPRIPFFAHIDAPGFDYGNGAISERGISLDKLRSFPIVISGHYHKYQKRGNLVYLGTPISHSFGESNQDKYIGIFDSNNHKLELLEQNFPKHITLTIDCDDPTDLPEIGNDYYRVLLTGSEQAILKYPRRQGIRYVETPTSIAKNSSAVNEFQSPEIQFAEWVKHRKLSKDIEELGLQVLRDV